MPTETEIKTTGVCALIEALGEVDAERFIAMLQRDPFDYTRWQRTLWGNTTIDRINEAAQASRGGRTDQE